MPPPTPRKNGTSQQPPEQKKTPNSNSGFPALQKDIGSVKPKYEEEQDEEILVLESIFGDDFQRVDLKGAGVWKVIGSYPFQHLYCANR